MNIKYCLPIIKPTKNAVWSTIEKYRQDYPYFEVWLDYINDLDEQFISLLTENLQEKLVVLFRRNNLEKPILKWTERRKYLSLFHITNAIVDLDFISQKEDLSYVTENKISLKLLLSYHNYERTPDLSFLRNTLKSMELYQSDIYKIAAYCHNETDALKLLELLLTCKKTNKKYIILGMGSSGIITRIFGTLWGNEMVYAPVAENEQSAPGQLTRRKLEKIFNEIQVTN